MAIIAEKTNDDFERLQAGTYQALCIGVYDVGFEKSSFLGQEKILHKIIVLWEVDSRMTKGEFKDKRFLVSKSYTLSLAEKANLRKDLESWQGHKFGDEVKSFDVEKIICANCLLSIVLNKNNYPEISAIMPLMGNMNKLTRETEQNYKPEWIKKKIEINKNNTVSKNVEVETWENDPYKEDDKIDF